MLGFEPLYIYKNGKIKYRNRGGLRAHSCPPYAVLMYQSLCSHCGNFHNHSYDTTAPSLFNTHTTAPTRQCIPALSALLLRNSCGTILGLLNQSTTQNLLNNSQPTDRGEPDTANNTGRTGNISSVPLLGFSTNSFPFPCIHDQRNHAISKRRTPTIRQAHFSDWLNLEESP